MTATFDLETSSELDSSPSRMPATTNRRRSPTWISDLSSAACGRGREICEALQIEHVDDVLSKRKFCLPGTDQPKAKINDPDRGCGQCDATDQKWSDWIGFAQVVRGGSMAHSAEFVAGVIGHTVERSTKSSDDSATVSRGKTKGRDNAVAKKQRACGKVGLPKVLRLLPWNLTTIAPFLERFGCDDVRTASSHLRDAGLQIGDLRQKISASPNIWKTVRVLVVPVWGEGGSEARPVNWIVERIDGERLFAWTRDGQPDPSNPRPKRKVIGGTRRGLIGDVQKIDALLNSTLPAGLSIKVEGASDWMTAILRDDIPPGTFVCTNPFGARDVRQTWEQDRWSFDLFANRELWVIHDADTPGQRGALGETHASGKTTPGWCQRFAEAGAHCKNITLPFPVETSHGQDLRDFFRGGGTFADLAERASAVDTISPIDPAKVESPPKNARLKNYKLVPSSSDNPEKAFDKEPISAPEIASELLRLRSGWPKACGETLFVPSGSGDFRFLKKQQQLYGWIGSIAPVDFMAGGLSRDEFFHELPQQVERFDGIERVPHFPPVENTYYASSVEPGSGEHLEQFLDFFTPETDVDRELILAYLATTFWGGPAGGRVAFGIDSSSGTGSGKSKLATSVARLTGGFYDISKETKNEADLRKSLMNGQRHRVAIIDNIKAARVSDAAIESLVTSPVLSGHALYQGNESRPNLMTWVFTGNGLSLSRDLAERTVTIRVGRPKRSADWDDRINKFVAENSLGVAADIASFFERTPVQLHAFSRWSSWESAIVARLRNPSAVQAVIRERSGISDSDKILADGLTELIREKLDSLGFLEDVHSLHVPNRVLGQWLSSVTGDDADRKRPAVRVDALIANGSLTTLVPNPTRAKGRGWIWNRVEGKAVNYELEGRVLRSLL